MLLYFMIKLAVWMQNPRRDDGCLSYHLSLPICSGFFPHILFCYRIQKCQPAIAFWKESSV